MILEASQEVGHIDEVEQTLMRRALTFGDQTVTDIMVPRTEMAALPTCVHRVPGHRGDRRDQPHSLPRL